MQILLNKHSGRFISQIDPKLVQFSDSIYLTIGFDSGEDFAKFTSDWRLLTEEVTEINKKTWLTKMLRRLSGEIAHLKTLLTKIEE